jgi:hypothetical protein
VLSLVITGELLHRAVPRTYFQTLAAQLGMGWISLGLLPGWNRSTASGNDLDRLDFFAGAAARTGQGVVTVLLLPPGVGPAAARP